MKHRGKQASDDKHFTQKWHAIITEAGNDLSFLLGKQYGHKSALALVGSHYKLNVRQQRVLSLITCPADRLASRKGKALNTDELHGKTIAIDGFNLLITVEAMLSGGYILVGQDGCHRDLSSIHGTYKKVIETVPAIALIDKVLKKLGVVRAHWYFDKPVSNAGMLKTLLYDYVISNDAPWGIDLVMNPDKVLIKSKKIVVSCDSWVIDNCEQYCDLARIIASELDAVELLDFSI